VNGRDVELETFPDYISPGVTREILAGETYRLMPNVADVRTVFDVGANLGAASVFFACSYPDATIHSFEPGPDTYALLERNTAPFASVVPHNFGLLDQTGEHDLYRGKGSPGEASIFRRSWVSDESDRVELRSAAEFTAEAGVERIDVLKVDTEGCELPILRGLSRFLADIQVIYVEFHSKSDWRELESMLSPSHELMAGKMLFESGELVYLRNDKYRQIGAQIDEGNLATR
jgi:FkbM family methyltransferase